MKKKIAVIGCGAWGSKRVKDFLKLGANIVALYDLNSAAVTQTIERNGLSGVSAFSGPLGAEEFTRRLGGTIADGLVDGVALLTPPMARAEWLQNLLFKGIPLYLEKPLCATADQVHHLSLKYYDSLFYYDRGGPSITATGHAGRSPALKRIHKILEDGEYGKMKALHFNYAWRWNYYNVNDWRGRPEDGGGHILEKLIHQLEGLFWALGGFKSVRASGCRLRSNPSVWNRFTAIFQPESEMIKGEILLSASFGTSTHDLYSIDTVFERGRILFYLSGDRFYEILEPGPPRDIGSNHYWWPRKQISTFMKSLDDQFTDRSTFEDAAHAMRVALALREALDSGSIVEISDRPDLRVVL